MLIYYVTYQISSHLVHKQGHHGNIFNFSHIWKKVWGRVITPLWCLKAPSPATKKWIFEFCTKFGFRNHLQTFWPRWLVKSELSLRLSGKGHSCLQTKNSKGPNSGAWGPTSGAWGGAATMEKGYDR